MITRAAETVDAIRNDAEGLRALQLEQIAVGKAALWDAYSAGDLGHGEQIALFEAAAYSPGDVKTYQRCYHTATTVSPRLRPAL